MPFTIEPEPSQQAIQAVSAGLTAYNEQHVGAPDNVRDLVLVVRDEAGAIIAGLVGQTFWTWLHVDMLWVHEAHRGRLDDFPPGHARIFLKKRL
jgi:hypothetical protein